MLSLKYSSILPHPISYINQQRGFKLMYDRNFINDVTKQNTADYDFLMTNPSPYRQRRKQLQITPDNEQKIEICHKNKKSYSDSEEIEYLKPIQNFSFQRERKTVLFPSPECLK
ncbi:Hypothetical_protein [Hexamita inflata]|uniref:Hypothetical_protein n=1 Tax=Hexamita inflata TaxID=28002 RepID=A0AA86NFK3_9EUKA|nr:Hypothetical protein HINF_LOCUS5858 [Hexamita inflata]